MKKISDSTINRLSKYYRTLERLQEKNIETVSSDEIAEIDGVTSAQVRKDLSFFGTFGKRGLGYNIEELKNNIGKILGLNQQWNVAVIGVGNIGMALIDYAEFKKQGFLIKLLLDHDKNKIGKKVKNLEIKNFSDAAMHLKNEKIQIVIIAVPSNVAQSVADIAMGAGIGAILNFAPLNIKSPETVMVKNENMSIELEALSYFLANK
ncbi:MAG: redox-sensing transcriptional repressor Rex [Spirochaetes bacterium]|nr:redox-sensing transcriptional repressor Rex [Calditrichia bacterium]MCK5268550.1 redox-sensing transcriptional repressor Rex [Spirochaetota bacterium]